MKVLFLSDFNVNTPNYNSKSNGMSYPNLLPLKQDTVSFKSRNENINDNKKTPLNKYKELTDAEFKTMKAEVTQKINNLPQIKEKLGKTALNSSNIFVLDAITNNPQLLESKNFTDNVGEIINNSNTAERAKAKCDVMDRIKNNPQLLENENFADNVGHIIYNSNTAERAKAKCDIMDRIKNNPQLLESKNFADKVGRIINNSHTAEIAKAKCDVMDYIKNNPQLLENKNFADNVGEIIYNSNTSENAKATCDVMDRIKNDDTLPEGVEYSIIKNADNFDVKNYE